MLGIISIGLCFAWIILYFKWNPAKGKFRTIADLGYRAMIWVGKKWSVHRANRSQFKDL